jgi:hypothetical protein
MTRSIYKRFVITLPERPAANINTIREKDGLSHSNFFCKAASPQNHANRNTPRRQAKMNSWAIHIVFLANGAQRKTADSLR